MWSGVGWGVEWSRVGMVGWVGLTGHDGLGGVR